MKEALHAKKRIVQMCRCRPGSGDKIYERIANEIFVRSFNPSTRMILSPPVSDAHWNDPITCLVMSSAGGAFYMPKKIVDLAEEHCGRKNRLCARGDMNPTNRPTAQAQCSPHNG